MRIPVTTLESFRLFRDYDFIDQDEIIKRIKREPEAPNERMWLGIALHKVLEHPAPYFDGGAYYTVKPEHLAERGFQPEKTLRFNAMDVDGNLRSLPDGVVELKTTYDIAGVTLSGIADLLHGVSVYDHKVSTKAPKPDSYAESVQWRCYLEMFHADRFVYNHIQIKHNRKHDFYEVVESSRFEHYRYPGMREDIVNLIGDFKDFVHMVGIEPQQKEAA